MTTIQTEAFPTDGYSNLGLTEVFRQHGIVHGLTELDRRSIMPPTDTVKAEIAAEIILDLVVESFDGTSPPSQ